MSAEDQAEKARSAAIDTQLIEESRRLKKEAKARWHVIVCAIWLSSSPLGFSQILLLGSGESGKSTVVKQMKILHQNGFSVAELHPWRTVVNKNLVESAQAIVLAMRTLNVDPENGSNRVCLPRFICRGT